MRSLRLMSFVALALLSVAGCGPTLSRSGQNFSYKPNAVGIGSTKMQVSDVYGMPISQSIAGKYEYYTYGYSRTGMNSGKMALSAVPFVGLATVFAGDAIPDTVTDSKQLVFIFDMATGVVRDYYYHDSSGQGQDLSETLHVKANIALKRGDRNGAIDLYKRSIAENTNNFRSLNGLAWLLIDMNLDPKLGVQYAERAVQLWPDSPYNTGTLGVGYLKIGEYKKAVQLLQTAVDLYPVYAPNDFKGLQGDKQRLEHAKSLAAQQGDS